MDKKDRSGIQFNRGDVVEIELNKYEEILKFKNLRSKSNSELKIAYLPKFYDGYYICVATKGGTMNQSKYDKVELLEPIKTAFKDLIFWVEKTRVNKTNWDKMISLSNLKLYSSV